MNFPLVFVTAATAIGMALGVIAGPKGFVIAGCMGIVCLVLLLVLGLGHRRFKWVLGLWFCALGMSWFLLYQAPQSMLIGKVGSDITVTGEIKQVRLVEDRQTLYIKLLRVDNQENSSGEGCLVYVKPNSGVKYAYGQIISFSGSTELLAENGNPGAFSYRAYQQRKGIYTQIRPAALPKIIGTGGNYLGYAVEWFHTRSTQITSEVMYPREAGVFLGILFGDTQTMTGEDKETFNITGVLHAFSVSGSNVAFVMFFGLIMFKFLPPRESLIATGMLVIFYTVLTGAEGPVVRASIMALLVLVGKLLGRRGNGINSLAIAALVMLLYNPRYLIDPGFQLSFAATWGLVVLVPMLCPQRLNLPAQVKEAMLFPIAAQLATLPLLAYYFNQISLVGIVANIVVTWFLAIILEVGLVALSLGALIGAVGHFLLIPLVYVIKFSTWLLELMARLPGAAFWVITPPIWLVCLYYLALYAWINRTRLLDKLVESFGTGSKRYSITNPSVWICVSILICGLLLTSLSLGISRNKLLEVEFLDVGQGDSILISTPYGRHYLLDGGPRSEKFDTGKSILLPYLFSKGIKGLDGVILSHPHDDHSGGLVEIMNSLKVSCYFIAGVDYQHQEPGWWQSLDKEVAENKVPVRKLSAGQNLELDKNVLVKVLSPLEPFVGTHSDPNNNSLVLELSYGKQSFLLTGDIELEAIQKLKDQNLLKTSIIKVPHHGSKYGLDKELFDQLNPPLVIISVGKNNSFGQPAPVVSDYWKSRNIPVLRTDQDGLIKLSTDGENLSVRIGRDQRLFK
jgi:competence protein ComEC